MATERTSRLAPLLVSVATAVPEHAVPQAEVRALVARMFAGSEAGGARLLTVFDHSGIAQRHFCMPLEWYMTERSFAEQNAHYLEHARALGLAAARRALAQARLSAADLDHVLVLSTTGIATPSLDAASTTHSSSSTASAVRSSGRSSTRATRLQSPWTPRAKRCCSLERPC